MKRFLLLAGLLLFVTPCFSQTPDAVLNPQDLQNEKWYYSMDSAVANPSKVYKLSLANTKLKEIPAEIFMMTNLQVLTLSENRIKKIPADIAALKNLQVLSLYKNKIKSMPLELKELTHLETLYLSRNKLIELPIWVGGMGNLRRLDISRNRITPLEVQNIRNMLPSRVELTY